MFELLRLERLQRCCTLTALPQLLKPIFNQHTAGINAYSTRVHDTVTLELRLA